MEQEKASTNHIASILTCHKEELQVAQDKYQVAITGYPKLIEKLKQEMSDWEKP